MRGSRGTNNLACVLSARIAQMGGTSTVLELGKIQNDRTLLADTFPIPIDDYLVAKHLTTEGNKLAAGDRVLIAWINGQTDAVVVEVVTTKGG